jgi:hypothetical protein
LVFMQVILKIVIMRKFVEVGKGHLLTNCRVKKLSKKNP